MNFTLLLLFTLIQAAPSHLTHIFDCEWSDPEEINQFPYRWEDVLEFERGYGHRLLPHLNFKLPSTILSLLHHLQHNHSAAWNRWGCSGVDDEQLKDLMRGVPVWRYELVFGRECRRRLPLSFWTRLDVNEVSHMPSLTLAEIPEGIKVRRRVRNMLQMRLDSFTE